MLLLIGFPEDEIRRIEERFEDVFPINAEWENEKVKDILSKAKPEEYIRFGGQRIVIMHDMDSKDISPTMKEIRSIVDEHIIFATTTPTSLEWELNKLVEELMEEDQYFRSM